MRCIEETHNTNIERSNESVYPSQWIIKGSWIKRIDWNYRVKNTLVINTDMKLL